MKKSWFGVKTYGVGLGPQTWQGWSTLGLYLITMSAARPAVSALHLAGWLGATAQGVFTAAFLVLIVAKNDGQPWRWRWGGRP